MREGGATEGRPPRTEQSREGHSSRLPSIPFPPQPWLLISPSLIQCMAGRVAATDGLQGSQSHPATLPGQPARADGSGERQGKGSPRQGQAEGGGNPCGASWGSEMEGQLRMKSSFSHFISLLSKCLSPFLSWIPVSPGQVPLSLSLSLGRVGASVAVWGTLNDASLIAAGGVCCFGVTTVLFLLLATSNPCHTGLLVLIGLEKTKAESESSTA